ncbi:MAG: hypothetical protein E7G47_13755 [Clostridium perfringens]|nr:hypothetical protein [Clostridium perfringens]
MDTLNKLQYITYDIRKSYDIPHLYSRVETLHAVEIKKVIKQLDLIKSSIDIDIKLRGASTSMYNFRNHIIRLILDTQELHINTINKNNSLIKKYNTSIIETLVNI